MPLAIFLKPKIKGFVFASYYPSRVMNSVPLHHDLTCGQRDVLRRNKSFAIKKSKVTTTRYPGLQHSKPRRTRREKACAVLDPGFFQSWRIRAITLPIFLVDLERHCHPVAKMEHRTNMVCLCNSCLAANKIFKSFTAMQAQPRISHSE